MRTKQRIFPGVFFIILILSLAIAGCGVSSPEMEAPIAGESETNRADEVGTSDEEAISEPGMELEGINACLLLPPSAVEAIIGIIRDEPEATVSMDREIGCRYINGDGIFYEIQLHPLDQWGLAEVTLQDAEPVNGVGAGAFVGTYPDAITLKGLIESEVMISIHAGDSSLETAIALFNLMADYLP